MKKQVSKLCSSALITLRKISSISKYLDRKVLERLVHAFISTKLDYCNSCLYGLPGIEIQKVQCIQNAAARLITKCKIQDHISPILYQLHWLTIKKRIVYKLLLLTFKSLFYQTPSYLYDTLLLQQHHGLTMCLISENTRQLYIKIPNNKFYGGKAYSVIAPKLWNGIPASIRESNSIEIFKKRLKMFLFTINEDVFWNC